jgi:hypothetical protein
MVWMVGSCGAADPTDALIKLERDAGAQGSRPSAALSLLARSSDVLALAIGYALAGWCLNSSSEGGEPDLFRMSAPLRYPRKPPRRLGIAPMPLVPTFYE